MIIDSQVHIGKIIQFNRVALEPLRLLALNGPL